MKKEDKKIIKELRKHKDLEMNLPAYANAYMNTVFEYSLIHLVLNYYTMKEVWEAGGVVAADAYLNDVMSEIHTLIYHIKHVQYVTSTEQIKDLFHS